MSQIKFFLFILTILVSTKAIHSTKVSRVHLLHSSKRFSPDQNESLQTNLEQHPSNTSTEFELTTGNSSDHVSNLSKHKKSLYFPQMKINGKWQNKRAGHGHKTKKNPYNYYGGNALQQAPKWPGYGNRGYSPESYQQRPPVYVPPKPQAPNTGYQNKNALSHKDISNLYYSSRQKSQPSQPVAEGSPSQGYTRPNYAPGMKNKMSKPLKKPAWEYGATVIKHRNRPNEKGKMYLQKTSVSRPAQSSRPVQSKQPQPAGSRGYYSPPHAKIKPQQATQRKNQHPPANIAQKWRYKGADVNQNKNMLSHKDISNLYYSAKQKSKLSQPVSGRYQSKNSPSRGYPSNPNHSPNRISQAAKPVSGGYQSKNELSHKDISNLYYSPKMKTKPSQPVSGGYHRPGSNQNNYPIAQRQQQWSSNNAGYVQRPSPGLTQSYRNYYSAGKRSSEQSHKVSTSTTNSPNATSGPGFFARLFQGDFWNTGTTSSSTTEGYRLSGEHKQHINKRKTHWKRQIFTTTSEPNVTLGWGMLAKLFAGNNSSTTEEYEQGSKQNISKRKWHTKRQISTTTTVSPNASTSGADFLAELFYEHIVGNTSSTTEGQGLLEEAKKNVTKRKIDNKKHDDSERNIKRKRKYTQEIERQPGDKNGKGEKHLVALTFSIREQKVKATFADSQNVTQGPEEDEEFTTPSMEDLLKKENAMLMDLVKVVSNNAVNSKPNENSGSAQSLNNNPEEQSVDVDLVGRPPQKKHMVGFKRTEGSVPDSQTESNGKSDFQKESGSELVKKHLKKGTSSKLVGRNKGLGSGGQFGGKNEAQKGQRMKMVKPTASEIKKEKAFYPKMELPSSKDDVPHAAPDEVLLEPMAPNEGTGENGVYEGKMSENDKEDPVEPEEEESEMVDDGEEDEELMDENKESQKKKTGTVEQVVIEESKKWKSKLTETFEKDSDEANAKPDEFEEETSDVTDEAVSDKDKKLVDRTAKMIEAMSILYKLAGNESKSPGNSMIKRNEDKSVQGKDIHRNYSSLDTNSASENDSIARKSKSLSDSFQSHLNPADNNASISKSTNSTANISPGSASSSIFASFSTTHATVKRNRNRKFVVERKANEETTNGFEDVATTNFHDDHKTPISPHDSTNVPDEDATTNVHDDHETTIGRRYITNDPVDDATTNVNGDHETTISPHDSTNVPDDDATTNVHDDHETTISPHDSSNDDYSTSSDHETTISRRDITNGLVDDEITNGSSEESTPRTQLIREATPEDVFTAFVSQVSNFSNATLDTSPPDISDDLVDTTEGKGILQTIVDDEPSTVDIDSFSDDVTIPSNI